MSAQANYDFRHECPPDDGDALAQIECELARDAVEVLDLVARIEQPDGLIAAALITNTDAAWLAVRNHYATQFAAELHNRAIDVLQQRDAESEACAAEWSAAA